MKRLIVLTVVVIGLICCGTYAVSATEDVQTPEQIRWAFDGPRGSFDRASAQRGFQVYKEVCAACHSVNKLAFRNLEAIGFGAEEVKAIASECEVIDGPNNEGDMFDRAGLPSDYFPSPFANEQAARASNNGAYPADLSLIVKARPDGANYVYSLLAKGYQDPPKGFSVEPPMNYNAYFPGQKIAMPAPLSYGLVTYQDGTEASVEQMSKDVVNFLQWVAEPETEHRHQMGIKVLLFLSVFTVLFFFAKRTIWRDVK